MEQSLPAKKLRHGDGGYSPAVMETQGTFNSLANILESAARQQNLIEDRPSCGVNLLNAERNQWELPDSVFGGEDLAQHDWKRLQVLTPA